MSQSKGLIIIGAGGHAKVVLSTAIVVGEKVQGFLDDKKDFLENSINGYPIFRNSDYLSLEDTLIFGLGNNAARKKLTREYPHLTKWKTLFHPTAHIDTSAEIGEGTVIFAGAIVQPNVKIGKHCIINTGATVDHDCIIGDYSHLAPGVHLAGEVSIGEGGFLGIGSVIIPGISVGDWVTVAAGSVLVDNVVAGKIVMGVPAKERPNDAKNN